MRPSRARNLPRTSPTAPASASAARSASPGSPRRRGRFPVPSGPCEDRRASLARGGQRLATEDRPPARPQLWRADDRGAGMSRMAAPLVPRTLHDLVGARRVRGAGRGALSWTISWRRSSQVAGARRARAWCDPTRRRWPPPPERGEVCRAASATRSRARSSSSVMNPSRHVHDDGAAQPERLASASSSSTRRAAGGRSRSDGRLAQGGREPADLKRLTRAAHPPGPGQVQPVVELGRAKHQARLAASGSPRRAGACKGGAAAGRVAMLKCATDCSCDGQLPEARPCQGARAGVARTSAERSGRSGDLPPEATGSGRRSEFRAIASPTASDARITTTNV